MPYVTNRHGAIHPVSQELLAELLQADRGFREATPDEIESFWSAQGLEIPDEPEPELELETVEDGDAAPAGSGDDQPEARAGRKAKSEPEPTPEPEAGQEPAKG